MKMSRPRVGLITFHRVHNFGAVLQAWSLLRAMTDLGVNAEVIDYRPVNPLKYRRRGWRYFVPSLGAWRIFRFMAKNLALTPSCRTSHEVATLVKERDYAAVVCGSDQIWMHSDSLELDSTYYLNFGPSMARRVAYAPSCGSMPDYGRHSEAVKRLLSNFSAISARDHHTVQLLKSLGVERVAHVLDPTFLVDFAPIIRRPPITRHFVAVVGPMNAAASDLVRSVGDKTKLTTIALGTRCPGANVEKRFVDPGEWLSYLAHSQFVISSLFHGTALAIKFHKPFVALDCGGRGKKIADLLERFGLQHRFLTDDHSIGYSLTPALLDLRYEAIDLELEAAIDLSRRYLVDALHGAR